MKNKKRKKTNKQWVTPNTKLDLYTGHNKVNENNTKQNGVLPIQKWISGLVHNFKLAAPGGISRPLLWLSKSGGKRGEGRGGGL